MEANLTSIHEDRGQSLALLRGLRIWLAVSCGVGCRPLRSGVAVAVAGSCSSNLTLRLGTCICCRCSPKKDKYIYIYIYINVCVCVCVELGLGFIFIYIYIWLGCIYIFNAINFSLSTILAAFCKFR